MLFRFLREIDFNSTVLEVCNHFREINFISSIALRIKGRVLGFYVKLNTTVHVQQLCDLFSVKSILEVD